MPAPNTEVIDGKYRVIRAIGEGGMGAVFLVEHVFLNKKLALKVLRPELANHPEAAIRFQREARATSLIEHENVVRVTDFGCTAEQELYLVMELLDGRTLAEEIEGGKRPSPTRALFIAAQMLRGLEAAHAQGVVHRDLKPENVFIVARPDGTDAIKLVDFGLAKLRREGDARLTTSGTVMGTPLYMAPEQVRGSSDIDARADLHAVGVILYELLAGRTPYQGEAFGAIAHEILLGRPPTLALVAPEVDPVLSALVMKSLASAREQRFQTATEMREALERHTPGAPLASVTSPFAAPRADQLASLPRAAGATTLGDGGGEAAGPPTIPGPGPGPSLATEPSSAKVLAPEAFAEPEAVALELDRPAPVPQPPAPPIRRNSRALLALAIALLLAGAIVVGWRMDRRPPPPPQVHVQIVDLPPGAQVFLDGTRAQATFDVPGSTAQRRLRLEARGYATRMLLLTPDSDQILDGRLDRSR